MCPAFFAVATLHVSLTCSVALCFVTRFLFCSPVFCAQHRLSHKLMVEAAATRKHLQASCCSVAVRLLLAHSTSPPMQRVVAQAFPSARPDIVDAAFAAPPWLNSAVCCVSHRFAAARRAAWVRGRRVSEQRFGFVGLILGLSLGAGVCHTRCGK